MRPDDNRPAQVSVSTRGRGWLRHVDLERAEPCIEWLLVLSYSPSHQEGLSVGEQSPLASVISCGGDAGATRDFRRILLVVGGSRADFKFCD